MEWFLKVVKEHYADFNGRARRKEYWMYTLVFGIIYFALYVLAAVCAFISSTLATIIFALIGIFLLALLVPSIAVAVRRVHDVGKSGWFILIPIYSLILLLTEGDKGENEYGSDPKANEN